MIITENIVINGSNYIHTYSDSGVKIRQDGTGVIYDDAIDPAETGRTYTETELLIEEDEETLQEYAEAGKILMGMKT